ncbi:hypothetical protein [Specibacter cremeus]|uniref:hypothetical protein n=1 Tax=Specibacter cremeus TaxID=1629051 RepID=UPI000F775030|nr:hypothetical protein [Specibacter cremeus]
MSENPAVPGTPVPRKPRPAWLQRTIVGVAIAAAVVVLWVIGSATLPLVWANSIAGQVGGNLGLGIPLGMFYGFVFSFVPVLVGWQAHHRRMKRWLRVTILAVAVALTIPNLLTLAVLNGRGNTAASARLVWATQANWFGGWSVAFMLVGVVLAVAAIVFTRIWRRNHAQKRTARLAAKAAAKAVRDAEKAARKSPPPPDAVA